MLKKLRSIDLSRIRLPSGHKTMIPSRGCTRCVHTFTVFYQVLPRLGTIFLWIHSVNLGSISQFTFSISQVERAFERVCRVTMEACMQASAKRSAEDSDLPLSKN